MLRSLVASVQLAAGHFHGVRHKNHDLFLPPGDESPTKPPAADTTGYIHNEPLLAQVEPFSARIDGFWDLCNPLHTGGGGFPGNLRREPAGKGQKHGSSRHRGRIPTRLHLRQRLMAGAGGLSAQSPNESQARGRLTAFQAVSQAGRLLLQLRGELRAKVGRPRTPGGSRFHWGWAWGWGSASPTRWRCGRRSAGRSSLSCPLDERPAAQ